MGAAQKQAAVAKKPSVSLASLNASHPLTKTAPSVKSVTGTQASCSKQETQTSWPQRALDAVKDVLLGAGNAFGRNMINGGATIVVAAGNVPSVAFPSVAFPSGALQFVNPSGKDIYEEGRRQWSNYINGVARDWTEGLESTTRSWATDQVRYDAGQIIGDVGTLAAEYAAFLKAAKVVSGAIKGISGMILADEATSSIAIAGAGVVAEGVTLESYLAVAAEIFLNFSAFKNDWNRLQEDLKEAEAKEAEEAVKEPEVKDGEVAVEEGGSSTSTLTIEEVEEYAFNAIEGPENADSVVLGKYEEGLPTSYDAVARDLDAQYFNLENWDELSEMYSQDEIWKINERFLDVETSSGREIYLSHDPYADWGASYYANEIQYLKDNGYRFIKEGDIWHAVR